MFPPEPSAARRGWSATHVAALLDEAVYHLEHLRLGVRDTTA